MGGPLASIVALAALTAALAAPPAGAAAPPDTVLLHGQVLLYGKHALRDQRQSRPRWAQAVAIRDGRIVAIGSDRRIRRRAGAGTKVVDLRGRMVMPGIVDGHYHGQGVVQCDMGYEGGTVSSVLAKLQACLDSPEEAPHAGSNKLLTARFFFGEDLRNDDGSPRALTRHDLDRLNTTRPIVMRHWDGHRFWTNTKAIRNAGITAATPSPPNGAIGREAGNEPNGFFSDYDADFGEAVDIPEARHAEALQATLDNAARNGLTSVFLPGGGQSSLPRLQRLERAGKLKIRVDAGLSAQFVRGDPADLDAKIAQLRRFKTYASDRIAVGAVKVFCDGVAEAPGFTAAMLAPYNVNTGTPSQPVWTPGAWRGEEPSCSDARAGFTKLDRAGWQIHIHGIGDRAVRESLDNFEAARSRDRRHTITHLEFVDRADLRRFDALGVVASMSLQWARRDGLTVDATEGYIEPARLRRAYPARDLWRAGAIIAGGSDHPVDPLRPMAAIETTVDRSGEDIPGVYPGAFNPDQGIPSVLAAIKMHTLNSAYQLHRENAVGSIEVGKQADLVVLDRNILAIPVERISEAKVVMTMVGGEVVHSAR